MRANATGLKIWSQWTVCQNWHLFQTNVLNILLDLDIVWCASDKDMVMTMLIIQMANAHADDLIQMWSRVRKQFEALQPAQLNTKTDDSRSGFLKLSHHPMVGCFRLQIQFI